MGTRKLEQKQDIRNKNRTSEKIGGTEDSRKNMDSGKNATFEKFGGTQTFQKIMRCGKTGTSEEFGRTWKFWKIMIFEKLVYLTHSVVPRNSDKS